MRTSELAGRAGVNRETLRYCERRGLLTEPSRTSGGYRDYPDAAVELLRFIKRAQELGFTLDEGRGAATPGQRRPGVLRRVGGDRIGRAELAEHEPLPRSAVATCLRSLRAGSSR
jgi:DNA-binding transcriptional MerR regulator